MLTSEQTRNLMKMAEESSKKNNSTEPVITEDSSVTEMSTALEAAYNLKPASFENAKRNLLSFSNRSKSEFGLDKVESSGGLFGWFDHNVTGDELNKLTTQIQGYLSKINGVNTDLIREFGQVYNALESLDKEYIPAILGAVKGAEIASNQAKGAAEHAKVAQEDIRKTVLEQKKIIKVLEDHKAKLDRLKHLENVDEIWNASKRLEQESNSFKKNFEDAKRQLSNLEKSIKSLQSFCNQILEQEHLEDIDETWGRLGNAEDSIAGLTTDFEDVKAGIECCNKAIESINLYVENLKAFEHLGEVDTLWSDVDYAKKELITLSERQKKTEESNLKQSKDISNLNEFKSDLEKQQNLFKIDELYDQVEANNSIVESNLADLKQTIADIVSKQAEIIEFDDKLKEQENLYRIDDLQHELIETMQKAKSLEDVNYEQNTRIKELQELVDKEKEENQANIFNFRKRLNVAYTVAGVATGLGILNLILSIVGVF